MEFEAAAVDLKAGLVRANLTAPRRYVSTMGPNIEDPSAPTATLSAHSALDSQGSTTYRAKHTTRGLGMVGARMDGGLPTRLGNAEHCGFAVRTGESDQSSQKMQEPNGPCATPRQGVCHLFPFAARDKRSPLCARSFGTYLGRDHVRRFLSLSPRRHHTHLAHANGRTYVRAPEHSSNSCTGPAPVHFRRNI